jgi:hypothetical protein
LGEKIGEGAWADIHAWAAWRILRQPARRVALWRAQYDSDKILPDLNQMTILDGPLLAQSRRLLNSCIS